jgi:hypothetical protein
MFIFDISSSRINSSNLFSLISTSGPWYHTQVSDFLRVDFHRTNYGVRSFNEFAVLIDLYLSRNQFINSLRSVLLTVHFSLLFFPGKGRKFFVPSIFLRIELLIFVLIRFFFIVHCFYICFYFVTPRQTRRLICALNAPYKTRITN